MSNESMSLPADLAAFGAGAGNAANSAAPAGDGGAAPVGAGVPDGPGSKSAAGNGGTSGGRPLRGGSNPAGAGVPDGPGSKSAAPAGDGAATPVGAGVSDGPYPSHDPAAPAADPFAAAREYHARASEFAAARCARWLAEAETLTAEEPDFDLAAAGQSRVCTALLRAGLPLRAAWRAANVDAVARRAAEEARAAVAADIRARGARCPEAGAAAAPAFGQREDVSRLSDAEVRAVLGRVERRERVSFG